MRDVRGDAAETTAGNVSAWLADAARAKLRRKRLQELVLHYEAEHGEITAEELAEVRKKWRG